MKIADTKNRNTTVFALIAVAVATLAFASQRAGAETVVYEGFQYNNVGDELIGKLDGAGGTDATGLAGTWVDSSATNGTVNDMFLKSGNLIFGDLTTAGNHIGFSSNLNNDRYNRQLTAGAQTSVSGANEIWFSVLFEKLQNNFSAGEGGFALANQVVSTPRIYLNDGTDGLAGFGFGPTTAGNDLKAYAWDGSAIFTGDAAISVPPNTPGGNTSGSNLGPVHLLVGQISFDSGTGGADEYSLFDYQLNAGSITGGSLSQIGSTLEVDVDQTATEILDTLNLTRQVNLNWDEVRIGTTLDDVLGISAAIPEPSTLALAALGLLGLIGFRRRRNR